MKVTLMKNLLDRWIIRHPEQDGLGWSGYRWTEIDDDGLPIGKYQVSNFDTKEEAASYAASYGFTL